MFGDVGATITSILHDYAEFNWVMTGTDTFACEGTSAGEHRDGPRRPGPSPAGPLRPPLPPPPLPIPPFFF